MRLGQTGKAKKLRLEKKIPLLKLENHAFSMEWCIIGLLCLLLRNVVIASMKARGGFSELIGALGPIAGEKLKHPNSEELDRKATSKSPGIDGFTGESQQALKGFLKLFLFPSTLKN